MQEEEDTATDEEVDNDNAVEYDVWREWNTVLLNFLG